RGIGSGRGRGGGGASDVPFYKKVFAFVFGPDEPRLTREQRDRELLQLLRARHGALTAAELVQHTGQRLDEADDELARLMAAHDGEPVVADNGTVVYTFPSLLVSAGAGAADTAAVPPPAWQRLEPPRPLTGNGRGTDAAIAAMNGFNLLVAASAPWFIFPRLGIGGPLAEIGLIWVPVAFSAVFYAVPLLRRWRLRRENRKRVERNLRRVVLGFVYESALTDLQPVSVSSIGERVRAALPDGVAYDAAVARVLEDLAAEFEADVTPGDERTRGFVFDAVRRAFQGAARVRARMALLDRSVGRIVYSSDDDAAAQDARDLESFDRELSAGNERTGDERAGDGAGAEATPADGPAALPPPDAMSGLWAPPDRAAYEDPVARVLRLT
ncbi:MAG: hypothetical protein D6701_01670, partial [Gemmatimonadetes bacterium]